MPPSLSLARPLAHVYPLKLSIPVSSSLSLTSPLSLFLYLAPHPLSHSLAHTLTHSLSLWIGRQVISESLLLFLYL